MKHFRTEMTPNVCMVHPNYYFGFFFLASKIIN